MYKQTQARRFYTLQQVKCFINNGETGQITAMSFTAVGIYVAAEQYETLDLQLQIQ